MMTPAALARSLPDSDLRAIVREALWWRSKGVLLGDALRCFTARLESEAGVRTDDTLQIADALVLTEAARRFADQ